MGTPTAKQTFGFKLAAELEQQQIGIRTLARRLERREGRTPTASERRVESIRRNLNMYVHKGRTPTDAARHEIEQELGVERDALKADDDDEAGDPPLRLLRRPLLRPRLPRAPRPAAARERTRHGRPLGEVGHHHEGSLTRWASTPPTP